MASSSSIIQLKCECNNYPWGKTGKESAAARLCSKTPGTGFKLDESKEYAEMWMGTYPELPAYVLSSGELLQDVLNQNKDVLIGKTVLDKFGTDLPFLPKVLSIAKALPLQLHPNKELSAKLHQEDPENFTDPNHKPEIAVAFGKFEVFAGFKPAEQIKELFDLEPLKLIDFKSPSSWSAETVRDACRALLVAPEDVVRKVSDGLAKVSKEKLGNQSYILDLLPRLQEQYSAEDNGNLVTLIAMNFLVLDAGDGLYIPADGIHAYLSGDIFECMARSNNVLNVGFCPRADRNSVDMFTKTLTFNSMEKQSMLLPSKPSKFSKNGKTVVYAPALSEFNLLVTRLGKGDSERVSKVDGPSIMIVLNGSGKMKAGGESKELKEGYIFFIGQGVDVDFEADEGLVAYRAYAD